MHAEVAVDAIEIAIQPLAPDPLIECRRAAHQHLDAGVHRRRAADLRCAGKAGDLEFRIKEIAALLEVAAVGGLHDQITAGDHEAERAIQRVMDIDGIERHLVAGEMHDSRGQRRFFGKAQRRQVALQELAAALHVAQRVAGAVAGGITGAADIAGIVEQRDQDAELGAARADPLGRRHRLVVAIDQPRGAERTVETVLGVVIAGIGRRIAGQQAGMQFGEAAKRGLQACRLVAAVLSLQQASHGVQHVLRVGDADLVGDVVMVAPSRLHGGLGLNGSAGQHGGDRRVCHLMSVTEITEMPAERA